MRRFVCLPYMLTGEMRIYLGSCYISMSEQFLNGSQICPTIQHMGSETVSQRVWSYRRIYTGRFRILFQDFPEPLPGQSFTAEV
jgi:hypothetical protein